jgi:hypothetical protein
VTLGVAGGARYRPRRTVELRWRRTGDGEATVPRLSLVRASRGHLEAKGEKRGGGKGS